VAHFFTAPELAGATVEQVRGPGHADGAFGETSRPIHTKSRRRALQRGLDSVTIQGLKRP